MLSSVLQTLSVVIAAYSFVYGVNAWRRTMLGEKRIQLAEEVIVGFEEARSAIAEIRSINNIPSEGNTRQKAEGETVQQTKLLNDAYVVIERYNQRTEIFAKLEARRYRFALYFGEQAAQPFTQLNEIVAEIIEASRTLARLWPRQGHVPERRREEHLERIHEAEAIFWDSGQEDDPLRPKIDAMVDQIKETSKHIVAPEPNFWTMMENVKRFIAKFFRRPDPHAK